MVGLTDGKKSLMVCITVYTQYRRVTDGQTDIFPWHSPRYATRREPREVKIYPLEICVFNSFRLSFKHG